MHCDVSPSLYHRHLCIAVAICVSISLLKIHQELVAKRNKEEVCSFPDLMYRTTGKGKIEEGDKSNEGKEVVYTRIY